MRMQKSKIKDQRSKPSSKFSFHRFTLDNGLRIVTVPMPQSPSAAAMVFVKVGSRYEPENLAGIAHFIEHNVFKGTKKRPSSLIINSEIEGLGGVHNAGTGVEYTCYWAKLAAEHIDRALDVILDISLNSIFPQKELEIERGNVIEEIRMYKDDPRSKVMEDFFYFVWDKHPVGRYIAGFEKTVRSIQRVDMLRFVKKHYKAQNILVAVAGKIDDKMLISQIEETCGTLPKGSKQLPVPVNKIQSEPRIQLETKDTQQTHFCLGLEAFNRHHKDRIALELLNTILGEGMSSRLFVKIREELGLAYYVGSAYYELDDTGLWLARAGVDNQRVKKALQAVLMEFYRLGQEKVSSKEFGKAKEYIKGGVKLSVETSSGLGKWFAKQELLEDEVLTPDEYCQRIDDVSSEDLQRVAQTLLRKDRLNLGAIGPIANQEELAEELDKVEPLQRLNLYKG